MVSLKVKIKSVLKIPTRKSLSGSVWRSVQHTLPGYLSIAVVNVIENGVICQDTGELSLKVGSELPHQ